MTGLGHPLPLALIALLPGAFALWQGRNMARLADDPALPERLLSNRRPGGLVLSCSITALLLNAGSHFIWVMPLLVMTRIAAGYPARKLLYRETWSLGGYLSFFLRLIVAAFGFWTVLAVTPGLVAFTGSLQWLIAGSLAVVLLGWSEHYSTVFSNVLRARPVDDPALQARFARMLTDCSLPAVALKQVDMRGGVFANAVALPSLRRPMVVVSSTLIERLEHDEVAAILAHELAHIEYYNPRRLRTMNRVTSGLVIAGALLSPAVQSAAPQSFTAMLLLWPVALWTVMARRAQDRQKHETESDLRALALAGDPEALVRALTKLHAFARIPRRWDTEFERHATHPSLARRIQAIRAAAGTTSAALTHAATFSTEDGSSSVTFHDDRLLWCEGPLTSHTIHYGQVTMLRVEAHGSQSPRLIAVDRAKRRWEIILQPSDVARAQATLDIVDAQLAEAIAPPVVPLAFPRSLAILILLAALTAGQVVVGLIGWIAVLLPAPPVAASAGAAALAAAALTWRDHPVWAGDSQPWLALALMASGLAIIAVSIANRRETVARPYSVAAFTALLAACTLVIWGAIAFAGIDPVDLHYAAQEWPSAALCPLALAAALALGRRPAFRYASVPLAAASGLAIAVGSTTFLDRFATDPLLSRTAPVMVTTIAPGGRDQFTVPFEVSDLRLSPDGLFVALGYEDEEEETTIHAGRAGESLTEFAADAAVFADNGRLLLLDRQRDMTTLRLVDLRQQNREVWSRQFPLSAVRMRVNGASSEWRLLGWSPHGDIVNLTGSIDNVSVRDQRWKAPASEIDDVDAYSVTGRELLALETRYRSSLDSNGWFGPFAELLRPSLPAESRFWSLSEHASLPFLESRLEVSCRSASVGDEATLCTAFDGARTGFFAIDPATHQSTAVASVDGHFYLRSDAGQGWVLGWLDSALVLVQAREQRVIRVDNIGKTRAGQLAIADKALGAAFWDGHDSTIRLYSIE